MRIAEIYESVQGEGGLTGTPSVFVRASGCNLRCHFCDTPFTSWNPTGDEWTVAAILDRVQAASARHVVVTGGEPMLFADLPDLCEALVGADRHVTIETAGTIEKSVACHLMSISPKLANSTPPPQTPGGWRRRHDAQRWRPEVVQKLIERHDYQLKFVVAGPTDINEVLEFLDGLTGVEPARVLLMPEGTEASRLQEIGEWLEPLCRQYGWGFCPRRHIEWFGARRGT